MADLAPGARPQALRFALAPMTNDFVALLKDSALVSVITVVELTKQTAIYATNVGAGSFPARSVHSCTWQCRCRWRGGSAARVPAHARSAVDFHARRTHQRHDLAPPTRARALAARRAESYRTESRSITSSAVCGPPARSSRRASRASGSDIARYTSAQSAPGTTQLPTLVA